MGRLTPQERKDRTAELYKFHKGTFKRLKIDKPLYIPKMAHFVKGLSGMHMGFFDSELSQGKDIYTERVSSEHESEDPTRTLYKITYNPFYAEEFAKSDEMPGGGFRYFYPVEEMEQIDLKGKKAIVIQESEPISENPLKAARVKKVVPDNGEDVLYQDMTIRDHAAITAWKPISSRAWLNNLIKNNPK